MLTLRHAIKINALRDRVFSAPADIDEMAASRSRYWTPRRTVGSFGPCGLEVLVARSIPYHRDRRFVIGVMDVEPGLGDALAGWRAPHRTAGRFAGTAAITGEIGEGLEGRYAMRCVVGHLRYDCELRLQVS